MEKRAGPRGSAGRSAHSDNALSLNRPASSICSATDHGWSRITEAECGVRLRGGANSPPIRSRKSGQHARAGTRLRHRRVADAPRTDPPGGAGAGRGCGEGLGRSAARQLSHHAHPDQLRRSAVSSGVARGHSLWLRPWRSASGIELDALFPSGETVSAATDRWRESLALVVLFSFLCYGCTMLDRVRTVAPPPPC
jgi:hypothetical protein